jgi:hypothetical protein
MLGDWDLEGELPKRSTKNQIKMAGSRCVVQFCLDTLERQTSSDGAVTDDGMAQADNGQSCLACGKPGPASQAPRPGRPNATRFEPIQFRQAQKF